MTNRHHFLTAVVNDDGSIGEVGAHTEVNGKPIPGPVLVAPKATTEGLKKLIADLRGE